MLIGILSDSHGKADTTRLAVKALADRGAEVLLHLGDIGSESVIDELIGHNARIVFGNCDWNIRGLTYYAQHVGVTVDHPLGVLEIDGKKIAYTHGDISVIVRQALDAKPDYFLHGHTHEVRDECIGGVRHINPGALCRATRYTAALLDPAADGLEIIEISDAPR